MPITDPIHDSLSTPPKDASGCSTHSETGVDLTLIRWMLSLTPTERLRVLQQTVEAIERLRPRSVESQPNTINHRDRKELKEYINLCLLPLSFLWSFVFFAVNNLNLAF